MCLWMKRCFAAEFASLRVEKIFWLTRNDCNIIIVFNDCKFNEKKMWNQWWKSLLYCFITFGIQNVVWTSRPHSNFKFFEKRKVERDFLQIFYGFICQLKDFRRKFSLAQQQIWEQFPDLPLHSRKWFHRHWLLQGCVISK